MLLFWNVAAGHGQGSFLVPEPVTQQRHAGDADWIIWLRAQLSTSQTSCVSAVVRKLILVTFCFVSFIKNFIRIWSRTCFFFFAFCSVPFETVTLLVSFFWLRHKDNRDQQKYACAASTGGWWFYKTKGKQERGDGYILTQIWACWFEQHVVFNEKTLHRGAWLHQRRRNNRTCFSALSEICSVRWNWNWTWLI